MTRNAIYQPERTDAEPDDLPEDVAEWTPEQQQDALAEAQADRALYVEQSK